VINTWSGRDKPAIAATVRCIMDADVSTFLEPLYEHLQTVLGELVAELGGLLVVVAKVHSGVVFFHSAPAEENVSG
jgi:hypothetical protein